MGFLHGVYRHEESLGPERLDASSAEDHPVRFLEALVDELDRAAGGDRTPRLCAGRSPAGMDLIAMPRRLATLG